MCASEMSSDMISQTKLKKTRMYRLIKTDEIEINNALFCCCRTPTLQIQCYCFKTWPSRVSSVFFSACCPMTARTVWNSELNSIACPCALRCYSSDQNVVVEKQNLMTCVNRVATKLVVLNDAIIQHWYWHIVDVTFKSYVHDMIMQFIPCHGQPHLRNVTGIRLCRGHTYVNSIWVTKRKINVLRQESKFWRQKSVINSSALIARVHSTDGTV